MVTNLKLKYPELNIELNKLTGRYIIEGAIPIANDIDFKLDLHLAMIATKLYSKRIKQMA